MPTRSLSLLALAAVLAGAVVLTTRSAEGQDAAPQPADRVTELEKRVASLQADVDILRRRERVITDYLVALNRAATNLHTMTQQARVAGFEMAAIPADSRIAVLRGLDQLGDDLARGLPAHSREDIALMKKADDLRKAVVK